MLIEIDRRFLIIRVRTHLDTHFYPTDDIVSLFLCAIIAFRAFPRVTFVRAPAVLIAALDLSEQQVQIFSCLRQTSIAQYLSMSFSFQFAAAAVAAAFFLSTRFYSNTTCFFPPFSRRFSSVIEATLADAKAAHYCVESHSV